MTPARYIVHPKVNICISETIITLVYSQLVLRFLFMVPERSIRGDSLLECVVLLYACSRREYGTPNGSTAFLLSVFVLEGFLASQPQNTQALLLRPEGKTRTGKLPYRTATSMYGFQMSLVQRVSSFYREGEQKPVKLKLACFFVVCSFFHCIMKGGFDLRLVYHEDKSFTHITPQTGVNFGKRNASSRHVEALASCLVEALIIAATKPNHQGQQSSLVWETLSAAATTKRHCKRHQQRQGVWRKRGKL